MTTYTLTQAQMDALEWHADPHSILRSLKPNSQEPVGYQFQDREGKWCGFDSEKHLADTRDDGSWPIRAIYTDPAPMSKADMVKVLEALKNSQEFVEASSNAKLRHGWGDQLDAADAAITIMQRIVGEVK